MTTIDDSHPDDFAINKERFQALYGSYVRAYERFPENGFKTSTALLVILGWLLSSSNARDYFADHVQDRWGAIGLISIAAVFLCLTFHRLSSLSRSLRARLDKLAFIQPEYYRQHQIVPLIYWAVVGQNFLACILIERILWGIA
jgi:hypothetical protein